MKCAKWVLLLLCLVSPTLHALDVSYGQFFKVTHIKRTDGQIILPVERKKYYNVRILNQGTYQFVKTCQAPCVQDVSKIEVAVLQVRPAKERPDMWIADVAFNQAWQATFLVFRQGDTYSVKPPANLIFLQGTLKQDTQAALVAAIKDML